MIKEKDIIVRVDENLKNQLKEKAKSLGLSVSSYIRSTLIEKLK